MHSQMTTETQFGTGPGWTTSVLWEKKALRNEANGSFSVNYLLQLNAKLELVSTKLNKQI